jgi:hypothetical protein
MRGRTVKAGDRGEDHRIDDLTVGLFAPEELTLSATLCPVCWAGCSKFKPA